MKLQNALINTIGSKMQSVISEASTISAKATILNDGTQKLSNTLGGLSCANSPFIKAFDEIQAKINSLRKKATSISFGDFKFRDDQIKSLELFNGTQQGTNPGRYAFDSEIGKLYYLKSGKSASDLTLTHIGTQAENEVLASKLYELAGVDCAKMELVTDPNGEKFVASEFIPNLTSVRTLTKNVSEGLGVDIWLANWDAICSNNIQTAGNKSYRIDFGGALEYKSLGELKNSYDGNFDIQSGFNAIVGELTSLFDPSIERINSIQNINTALTQEDLIVALRKVAVIDDKKIEELVSQFAIDGNNADELTAILLKRKEYLTLALELIEKTPKSNNQTMFDYLQAIQEQVNSSDKFKNLHAFYSKNKSFSDGPIKFTQEELAGIAEDKEMKKIYDYYIENYDELPENDVVGDLFSFDDAKGRKSCEEELLRYARPTLKQACERYQGWDEYACFNKHLREGELTYTEKTMSDGLIALFNKKGATIKTRPDCNVLYRGVYSDCCWNINGQNINISDLKIGDEFIEKGFSSTSKNLKVGENYANHGYLLKIIPCEETKLLDIDLITNGFALRESEILLRNNTMFRVLDIQGNEITLQALN